MSVMIKDLLTTYKLGWKTSTISNTYDFKTDPSEIQEEETSPLRGQSFPAQTRSTKNIVSPCNIG